MYIYIFICYYFPMMMIIRNEEKSSYTLLILNITFLHAIGLEKKYCKSKLTFCLNLFWKTVNKEYKKNLLYFDLKSMKKFGCIVDSLV